MSNYSKNAEDIITYLGGSKNIEEVKHCFTRLRFKVKDNSKVNVEMLEKIPCVVRVMKTMGQIQVVVGNEIDEVYKVNIPKWRSHLIRQNRATYSNLENHLIQITEPGNPI